jgi:hypothetical protein
MGNNVAHSIIRAGTDHSDTGFGTSHAANQRSTSRKQAAFRTNVNADKSSLSALFNETGWQSVEQSSDG